MFDLIVEFFFSNLNKSQIFHFIDEDCVNDDGHVQRPAGHRRHLHLNDDSIRTETFQQAFESIMNSLGPPFTLPQPQQQQSQQQQQQQQLQPSQQHLQQNLLSPNNNVILHNGNSNNSSNLTPINDSSTAPTVATLQPYLPSAHVLAVGGCSHKIISQPYSPPLSPTQIASSTITSPIPLASGPEQTSETNWQANKNSVRERNAAMFNNDLISDIAFIVGAKGSQQRIPAHKYVLAIGSSVFYAMFYGGLAEANAEIEIPDVEPSAFLALLRYIYCDDICLEADNVLATLYAAKKYLVPNLARSCVEYLETSLTARNACVLLSQSRLFEEPDLMQRCWEVIDAQAELALNSEGFTEIDYNTLESILSRETLNAKELSIFYAALNWATSECERNKLETTPENQRKVLKNALYLIRIPTMTLEEFANGPAQSGILTLEENVDIFFFYTSKTKPNLSFQIKPRQGLKMQICHRFQSSAYRSNQWRYRGRCDSIQFSVDKRIFVVGFRLYGSSNGAADYKLRMELKRMGKILAENETRFFSDGSSNTFPVYFKNPVQIEADTLYTASVILDGAELSYFGQDGLSEVLVNGNVLFQFQCSSDSTNGTGVQGGQIPELIFYGPLESSEL